MDRYKQGIEAIRKGDATLQTEKEALNRYVLNNFNAVSDKIKHSLAVENKRLDLILDEFDKPAIINFPQKRTGLGLQSKKDDLVNDYIDLYKNFNEFNSKNNPQRAQEIKVDLALTEEH